MLLREGVPGTEYPVPEKNMTQARTRSWEENLEIRQGLENTQADWALGTRYSVLPSVNRLQFFPRLEPNRFAGRN
jgi:hypothetical protein